MKVADLIEAFKEANHYSKSDAAMQLRMNSPAVPYRAPYQAHPERVLQVPSKDQSGPTINARELIGKIIV